MIDGRIGFNVLQQILKLGAKLPEFFGVGEVGLNVADELMRFD